MQTKYTDEQIKRLFARNDISILEQAAHIAASKSNKKAINEEDEQSDKETDDFDNDDDLDSIVDAAATLMDQLREPCGEIADILVSQDSSVINALIDHLEDTGSGFEDTDEPRDSEAFRLMKIVLKSFYSRN
jgi:DNA-directed RNA polymerase specialized sigma54-like protein